MFMFSPDSPSSISSFKSFADMMQEMKRYIEELEMYLKQCNEVCDYYRSLLTKLTVSLLKNEDNVDLSHIVTSSVPELRDVLKFLEENRIPYEIVMRKNMTSVGGYNVEIAIIKVPGGFLHVAIENDFGGYEYIVLKREIDPEFWKKLGWVNEQFI